MPREPEGARLRGAAGVGDGLGRAGRLVPGAPDDVVPEQGPDDGDGVRGGRLPDQRRRAGERPGALAARAGPG